MPPAAATGEAAPRLQLTGISKRYPGVLANDGVNLTVQRGEIHAILGENGAGKSTLMKIIYGATQADEGRMCLDGQPIHLRNPQQARERGIAMVFQHFSLFESLTVADNIWLGQSPGISRAQLRQRVEETARFFGLDIDLDRPVHTLSVGEMQRVEILRSLLTHPQLLILDEPTSVLTPQAVQNLFGVLRKLAAQGCSILYISHKLDEIRQLCHACTVMRQGRVVGAVDPRQCSNAELSRLMIGAEPAVLSRPASGGRGAKGGNAAPVLRVQKLNLPRQHAFGVDLQGISLHVDAGEVVGIAGVSGNGQKELLLALSGEMQGKAGERQAIQLLEQPVGHLSPHQRRQRGLHCVPEERLGRGAVPGMDLAHNLLLTRDLTVGRLGWIHGRRLVAKSREIITRFHVRAAGPGAAARSLSGGNLQKYIVGREIDANPRLLVLAQPTWGVDVGAAARIHAEILALRAKGCAVLVVSEELDELFAIADRLYVMAKGKISPSLHRDEASVQKIGLWMSGLWSGPGGAARPAAASGTAAA